MTDALSGRVWVAAGKTTSTVQSEVVVPLAVTTLGELKTVSTGGGGPGSTQVSVQNVAGTTLLASLTTASAVQTEPKAGAVFGISGNTTAIITTASRIQAQVDALTTASIVRVEGITTGAALPISGNTTVIQGTSPWGIAGNTTAAQGAASSANPWFIQNDSSHLISVQGNTTAAQGAASSANPWFVQNDSSHALTIQGNTSAVVSGNTTVIQGNPAVSSNRWPVGWVTSGGVERGSSGSPVVTQLNTTARIHVCLENSLQQIATAATLVTMNPTTQFTTAGALTDYIIAAGRNLYLQTITAGIVQVGGGAVQSVELALRVAFGSGATTGTAGSPTVWRGLISGNGTSAAGQGAAMAVSFGDGLEVPANTSASHLLLTAHSITTVAGGTTATRLTFSIVGYEF